MIIMKNITKIFTLLMGFNFSSVIFADEIEADDAIKYRKAVMSAIKGHNAAIRYLRAQH